MKYAYQWNVRYRLDEINLKTSNAGFMCIKFFEDVTISKNC